MDGARVGCGYSGYGPDKNQPCSEGKEGRGPIPSGVYFILSPRDTEDHGPYVLPLLPADGTRQRILALGRDPDSFLIHGDSIAKPGMASKGCVIQAPDVRKKVWDSGDHTLMVISGLTLPDVDGEICV